MSDTGFRNLRPCFLGKRCQTPFVILTDTIFEKAVFFPEKVLLETSSTSPHIAAVEEGIAVSIIPKPRNNSNPHIITLHLDPGLKRHLYTAYRKEYLLSKSQRFFIDLMKDFYANATGEKLPSHLMGW